MNMNDLAMGTGQQLYKRAKTLIPGGTQLLSKRPEMFLPEQWPSYFSKARGVEVWDLDGNRYIDMSTNGIGACTLGVGDPDIDAAVKNAIDAGNMSTLNCPEEVELAELLCQLHPWADMVRYARGGGEAMAVAVRIARAHSRKDNIAFCGYHGWHDWYLSANLAEEKALDGHLLPGLDPAGVPRVLIDTAMPFRYNHPEDLDAIISKHRNDLAAIVMEPIRDHNPVPGFLESVRKAASDIGVALIVDEVSAGFRMTTGGAHTLFGIEPDMAVFAKAIGNGYPMAAVIGKKNIMQASQSSFISSTYWTERIGPSAAIATIGKHKTNDVPAHLNRIGKMVQRGWLEAAKKTGLSVDVGGIYPLSHFAIQHEQSQAAHTLFTQILLEKGFLASRSFYATYAHRDEHIESYLKAVEESFEIICEAMKKDKLMTLLKGPVAHAGFKRLT
jgi:glutamate-1-semialdehyde 2,1-aminomutase